MQKNVDLILYFWFEIVCWYVDKEENKEDDVPHFPMMRPLVDIFGTNPILHHRLRQNVCGLFFVCLWLQHHSGNTSAAVAVAVACV